MKILNISILSKIFIFVFIILASFVLFSSKTSAAPCSAITCPPGFICEDRGSGNHCYAPVGNNCTSNGNFCTNGPCPAGSTSGGGLCSSGLSCCTAVANSCGSGDCVPACTSGTTCTGTKPSCSCSAPPPSGGGGGPPPATYVIGNQKPCIGHGEPCKVGSNLNGQVCCPTTYCSTRYVGSTLESDCFDINPNNGTATNCSGSGCQTAVGNVPTNAGGFAQKLFAVLLSISGGIALILIIISGYRLMTSRGNPEQVQAAKEQLTAAIVGLLFVIFSLVVLQTIGVNILNLPGFKAN
jgi:hypothetical protein